MLQIKANLLPGRFPSPTPSRETTPFEVHTPLLPGIPDIARQVPQADVPSRPASSDFTAASQFRNRPQFKEAQSEPTCLPTMSALLPSDRASPLASPCNPYRTAKDRRRVSDPLLHSRSGRTVRNDPSAIRKTRQKRQRLSDTPQYYSCPTTPSQSSTTSQPPSTPPRRNTSLTESHNNINRPSPREGRVDNGQHTERKSESEQNRRGTPEKGRSRSSASPKTPVTPRDIHAKIRSALLEDLTFSEKKGIIYILHDPDRPELGYKIGATTRSTYLDRINEHRQKCNFEPNVVHEGIEIDYCFRTEKLIQAELDNFCQHWDCTGTHKSPRVSKSETHEEYFLVSEELAIQTAKKWEDFMRREKPYGWSGKLKPVWRYLLEKRRCTFIADDPSTKDFLAVREHWNTVMRAPPETADYVEFYWRVTNTTCANFLPSSSLILSFQAVRNF
ncbi:hypothetical protein N0V83_010141 [Neocucurbitaria cava]|uniref:Bacteriophage T5 Orf172 DNA-binding domain-containing protein n=1 Tax=Neocucurbitaria cava TaxID=798079 RepID=A0A9W8XZ31_9PLEO|nr:hypothetical protein N0V83_010141 [Neocucurbitaria cava]